MGRAQTPKPEVEEDITDTSTTNLGTLTEQPTVMRDPVASELEDGTVRTDY